uniref:Receptor-like protein kinase HAIKU2 n=1 Tax=Aegilops tauschii TaxID=37682 RepID=M8C1Q3_AEGTA
MRRYLIYEGGFIGLFGGFADDYSNEHNDMDDKSNDGENLGDTGKDDKDMGDTRKEGKDMDDKDNDFVGMDPQRNGWSTDSKGGSDGKGGSGSTFFNGRLNDLSAVNTSCTRSSSRPTRPPRECSSGPAATLPIMLNEQAIINNLTDNNVTRMWPNRRAGEDERLYLVHNQGTAGINTRYPLLVKKFQNVNPALQVDGNVRYRYKSEMILLASNSHDNIIKVVDIIQREDAIMLVFEYPVNGSLQSWLHQPMDAAQPLSWPERRVIAIGVGQGLCHLHHGCNKPIVHHNISSDNILLDRNFKAVIASFGDAQMNMAGLGQPLPITDLPPGNFGEFCLNKLGLLTSTNKRLTAEYGNTASPMTEKVDTYSFGVLLLVLVTGREPNGAGADCHLAVWARNFAQLTANQLEIFEGAVDMVIPDQAQQRPSMRMALKRLRGSRGRSPFGGLLTCYLLDTFYVYVPSTD